MKDKGGHILKTQKIFEKLEGRSMVETEMYISKRCPCITDM